MDLKKGILIYEKTINIFIIQKTICTKRIIWEKFLAFNSVDISLSSHKLGAFAYMEKNTLKDPWPVLNGFVRCQNSSYQILFSLHSGLINGNPKVTSKEELPLTISAFRRL